MNVDGYKYAACYCEENIWHLCQEKDFHDYGRKVVLISNPRRSCALWEQNVQHAEGEPVIWDYHVIMLFFHDEWEVYDLDTVLETPTPFAQYIRSTFGQPPFAPAEFLPLFRVIDAGEFVSIFSSDRSHMLTPDGHWQMEPPPWPAIVRNGKSNLMDLIDMEKPSPGMVMTLSLFSACFS